MSRNENPTCISFFAPRGAEANPSVKGGWLSMEAYLAWVANRSESNTHELEESLRQDDPPCLIFEEDAA